MNQKDFNKKISKIKFKSDDEFKNSLRSQMILEHKQMYQKISLLQRAQDLFDWFIHLFQFRTLRQAVLVTSFSLIILVATTSIIHPRVRGAVTQTVVGVSKCGVDIECISDIAPLSEEVDLYVSLDDDGEFIKEVTKKEESDFYELDFGIKVGNNGPDAADFVKLNLDVIGSVEDDKISFSGKNYSKECSKKEEESQRILSCDFEIGTIEARKYKDLKFSLNTKDADKIQLSAKIETKNKYLEENAKVNNKVIREYIIQGIEIDEKEGLSFSVTKPQEVIELKDNEGQSLDYTILVNNHDDEIKKSLELIIHFYGKVESDIIDIIENGVSIKSCDANKIYRSGAKEFFCTLDIESLGADQMMQLNYPIMIKDPGDLVSVVTLNHYDEEGVNILETFTEKSLTKIVSEGEEVVDYDLEVKGKESNPNEIDLDELEREEVLTYDFEYTNLGKGDVEDLVLTAEIEGPVEDNLELVIYLGEKGVRCTQEVSKELDQQRYSCAFEIDALMSDEKGLLQFHLKPISSGEIKVKLSLSSRTYQIFNAGEKEEAYFELKTQVTEISESIIKLDVAKKEAVIRGNTDPFIINSTLKNLSKKKFEEISLSLDTFEAINIEKVLVGDKEVTIGEDGRYIIEDLEVNGELSVKIFVRSESAGKGELRITTLVDDFSDTEIINIEVIK